VSSDFDCAREQSSLTQERRQPRLVRSALAVIAALSVCALAFVPSALAAAPVNDDFASAQTIVGNSGSVAGTNAEATAEPNEPDHAGYPAHASVWYRWTAPDDGLAALDTCTAVFDTRLAVYTGSALDALTDVASSDNSDSCAPGSLQSSVSFIADKDVTYRIAVDGFAFETGSFTLSWERLALPPTNVSRPVVSGSTRDGDTLSVAAGEWSSTLPVSYRYQWQRCGSAQSNVALARPALASHVLDSPGYEPSKAVDGSLGTYWNSGDYAPQWIAVDLQAPYPLSKIRAHVAQLPDGETVHELWVAGPNPRDDYRLLRTFAGFTKNADVLEQAGPSEQVEFVKIETTASPSWVAWSELEALSNCVDTRARRARATP
jgi:F5/8 type C domain